MACNLTKGRSIGCRDAIGGVKALYIVQLDHVDSYTTANGQLTEFDMGSNQIFKYTLKRGTGSVTETVNPSSENGTVFFTHSCNMKLHNLTSGDQREIRLLAQQRMVIFAELNQLNSSSQNVILAMGLDNGMELSAGTSASGAALGDMAGYDWTFEAQEYNPIQVNEDYTSTPFDSTGFTHGTIIES